MSRATVVTDRDLELLRAVARTRSVVAAGRALGISRDRAVYRVRRLAGTFRGPLVRGERGGKGHGESRLTALGERIVRRGFAGVELGNARARAPPVNLLRGRFHPTPVASVVLASGVRLRVAFPAEDGAAVRVALDPEAILVARRRFATSARNVLAATVVRVPPGGASSEVVTVRVGRQRLGVALTPEAVRQLRLAPGRPVWLYVKATALRRVA